MQQPLTNMRDLAGAFASAMNLISPEVQDHHQKTAYLAYRLAEALSLDEGQRQLAVFGALLHDIGSVTLPQITLEDVERSAGKLAKTGGSLLKSVSVTRPLSEVVENSQTPWRRIRQFAGRLRGSLLTGQIVHLSDTVSLLFGNEERVLNRVAYVKECIGRTRGEYPPDLLEAFEKISRQDYIWMDMLYRPGRFLEFIPASDTVTLDSAVLMTELVSHIIDFRSPFTAMHSAGVAASAECLARLTGMSEDECRMMRIAGNLHDLGKLKIPREILEKPGKLTDAEFNIMKEHAYYTYVLLKDIHGFEQITRWAAFHHEKLNGNGYPFRLSDREIPFGSRIMAAADVFSAITEERPYRKGMDREKAVQVLRENVESGGLSGSIVELLISHYDAVDAERDRASREAGKRYFDSIGQGEK